MLRTQTLAFLCLAFGVSCTTPDRKVIKSNHVMMRHDDFDSSLEVQRPTKASCRNFVSETGIRVTQRENGRPVAGIIRILAAQPGLEIYVISDFNNWGQNKTSEDRLLPVPGTPYYEGRLRYLRHGMEYRLLVDGQPRIDPSAVAFTAAPLQLNSVFWDLNRDSQSSYSIDLRRKQIVMAEVEVFSLAKNYPRRDHGVGPISVNQTYKFVAESGVIEALKRAGYNAVQFLPIGASLDRDSWRERLNVYGFFAPDSRYGTPDEFADMVNAFHRAGVAVILKLNINEFAVEGNSYNRDLKTLGLQRWKSSSGDTLFGGVASNTGRNIFDLSNRSVRRFIRDSVLHMVCNYGLSGIQFHEFENKSDKKRLDLQADFVNSLAREVRLYKPEILLVGGVVANSDAKISSLDLNSRSNLLGFLRDNLTQTTEQVDVDRLRRVFAEFVPKKSPDRFQTIGTYGDLLAENSSIDKQYVASQLRSKGQFYTEKKTMAYGSVAMLSSSAYIDLVQTRLLQEGNVEENPAVDWQLKRHDKRRFVYDYFAELSNLITQSSVLANDKRTLLVEAHVEIGEASRVVAIERSDGQRNWLAVVNLGHVGLSNYRVGTNFDGSYRLGIDSDSARFGGSGEFEDRLATGTIVADGGFFNGRKYSVSLPYLAPFATVVIYRE